MKKPNVIFVFADQLRYQATGFGGDVNVRTPHLDRLSRQSVNFLTAVSGCPVCSPARASLLTGQYPNKHGVFVNDVCLSNDAVSIAESFKGAGYDTAYIGKWHLDGHGRSNPIPPERRHGFEFWRVLECTHQYNQSHYYADDDTEKRLWDGYDAIAQTREAQHYIQNRTTQTPFFLMLSWGPPHAPYQTAPERYQQMYTPEALELHPNVPAEVEAQARRDLAGYYAHITALDDLIHDLLETVKDCGIQDNTIFVFWSDHGDMLGSQGEHKKQTAVGRIHPCAAPDPLSQAIRVAEAIDRNSHQHTRPDADVAGYVWDSNPCHRARVRLHAVSGWQSVGSHTLHTDCLLSSFWAVFAKSRRQRVSGGCGRCSSPMSVTSMALGSCTITPKTRSSWRISLAPQNTSLYRARARRNA